MAESDPGVLREILILLVASVLAVALLRRLRLPPVLGYLAVGTVVGPHALGLIEDEENTRLLAQFGVVFLMFTVGLKFSLAQVWAMRRTVLGLGGAQVALTTGFAGGGAWLLGLPALEALVVGGVVAMSSTAMVVKLLREQLELNRRHGRNAVGVLLFQDIAVLPFLIVVPVLAGDGEASVGQQLVTVLGKGSLIVLLMLAAGRWLLRPVLHEVARARSSELFTLTALLFALTAAGASHAAGLSMPLGAFLAGMMLGETEYRHQVEADIRPFQDVLLGLFFVSVGMLVDFASLSGHLLALLLLTATLVLFKGALVTVLGRVIGLPHTVALRTGIVLAQGGEFGLAILSLTLDMDAMARGTAQVVLSAVVLSMVLAPFLVRYNEALARRLQPAAYRQSETEQRLGIETVAERMAGHVVIAGYGRIGQSVARFLDQENVPYVALDLDPVRVREARAAGESVVYGDATQLPLLEAAGIGRARVVVVSFDDADGAEKLLSVMRAAGHEAPALVRTRDDNRLESLQRAGATEVVPETVEASLMLVSHLLLLLDIPVTEVARRVQAVRRDRYRLLRGFFLGQEPVPLELAAGARERLHTVTLPTQAHAVGRQLGELALGRAGVVVTAVRRGGIRGPQPQQEMLLRAGDSLVLYGTPEELARSEAILLRGGS